MQNPELKIKVNFVLVILNLQRLQVDQRNFLMLFPSENFQVF